MVAALFHPRVGMAHFQYEPSKHDLPRTTTPGLSSKNGQWQRNVPLRDAVERLVPARWKTSISPDIATKHVFYMAGRPWENNVRQIAQQAGATLVLDAATRKVEITSQMLTKTAKKNSSLTPLKIKRGSVKSQLTAWATGKGYQLVWNAKSDHFASAAASFHGENVESVVTNLFRSMRNGGSNLKARIFRGNKVIVVED
jgi:hypothetical protein